MRQRTQENSPPQLRVYKVDAYRVIEKQSGKLRTGTPRGKTAAYSVGRFHQAHLEIFGV